jgi:Kef-type K+ transport system membrane component KefB
MKDEIKFCLLLAGFLSTIAMCFMLFFGGMELMMHSYKKDWYLWMNGAAMVVVGIPCLVSLAFFINRRMQDA